MKSCPYSGWTVCGLITNRGQGAFLPKSFIKGYLSSTKKKLGTGIPLFSKASNILIYVNHVPFGFADIYIFNQKSAIISIMIFINNDHVVTNIK